MEPDWQPADPAFFFVEAPNHPDALMLWHYWQDKCAGRPMPDRADINIVDLAAIAPYLAICETVDDGTDFRLRLYGSELRQMSGEERTGKLLSELGDVGNHAARWSLTHRLVFERQTPVFVVATDLRPGKSHVTVESVTLPLTHGGSAVGQTIGGVFRV